MKFEQGTAVFRPVIITLTTQEEVNSFNEMARVAYNNLASHSAPEIMASELMQLTNNLAT